MRYKTKKKITAHLKRMTLILVINASIVVLICVIAGHLTIPYVTKGLLYSAAVMVVVALWSFTSGGEMYNGRAGIRYISTAGYTGQEDKELVKAIAGEDSKQVVFGFEMLACAAVTALAGIL